jgi:hypothetical protein
MSIILFEEGAEAYCIFCGLPVWSATGKFHFANLAEAEHTTKH